jgi:hypothetical protein
MVAAAMNQRIYRQEGSSLYGETPFSSNCFPINRFAERFEAAGESTRLKQRGCCRKCLRHQLAAGRELNVLRKCGMRKFRVRKRSEEMPGTQRDAPRKVDIEPRAQQLATGYCKQNSCFPFRFLRYGGAENFPPPKQSECGAGSEPEYFSPNRRGNFLGWVEGISPQSVDVSHEPSEKF